jgi:putative transposase
MACAFIFSGLSLRRAFDRLSSCFVKRNHVSIWNWIQKYRPRKASSKRRRIDEFIIGETLIKIGSEHVWLRVAAIELESKEIDGCGVSKERNMLIIAEGFISKLVKAHGPHPVPTDGGTWYPQACGFLGLKHHIHSSYEKSIIERTMQCIKDRTESFDYYFPCRKREGCKLMHVRNWFNLFADFHNKGLSLK